MSRDTSDDVKALEEAYRYETDAELERKRHVYRSQIVAHTLDEIAERSADVEANSRRYNALSEIIRRRERAKHRREFLKELLLWGGVLTPFVAGWGASSLLNATVKAIRAFVDGPDDWVPVNNRPETNPTEGTRSDPG